MRDTMFDAVFFDLDGTLIDTESLALRSGMQAFADFGHDVGAEFMHGLVGKAEPQADALIRAAFPALDHAAFSARWRQAFQHALETDIPLKPGVTELLPAIALPKALVTSTGREGAHWKLRRAGLDHHFATVVTFHDVAAPKPAPDPYLLAAERLGVDPARCVVFEDSEVGAESAHRAGCVVVQVPDMIPSGGRFARHLAQDLMSGARLVGLV
ncbi:MAG: hypothetical protein RIR62_2418 [Pseudomonadota bacterium]|jgi:HAD superfamily hydrolase (TIGR01509 family)